MQATVLVNTKDMSVDEWKGWRLKGIGGSDVAVLIGASKYKSPIGLYLEKTGQVVPPEAGEAAYWGTVLEDVVAKEFAKRTGLKVKRINSILQHPEHKFMLANIDRKIVGVNEGLECKTASEYLKKAWEDDEVPDAYYLQCQHYMAVTGYERWWIAALVGGNKFVYKCIERDEKAIEYLMAIEAEFWNYVEEQVPPPFDGTQASSDLLNIMYPEGKEDTMIDLPSEVEDLITERESASEEIKAAEERKKAAENKIKALMGEYEIGLVGEREVRWKTVRSNRIDSKRLKEEQPSVYEQYCKESVSRRFEIK